MAFGNLKPETIKRLEAKRDAERKASSADLENRLREKAEAEGPDSIWAEMLAEHEARRKERGW